MGYDAWVDCQCFRDGRTTPPPYPVLLTADGDVVLESSLTHDPAASAATGSELVRFTDASPWWWRNRGHGADAEGGRIHLWQPGGPDVWTAHFGWTPGRPARLQPLDADCGPISWFGPDLATEVLCHADEGRSPSVAGDVSDLLRVVDAALATGQPVRWG